MPRKILTLIGDRYHPVSVLRPGLSWLTEEGWLLDFVEEAALVPWGRLNEYSALLLAKGGYEYSDDMTRDCLAPHMAFLEAYVAGGGGLLAVHSGISGYAHNETMKRLCRGSFTHHPEGLIAQRVRWLENPFFERTEDFVVMDEQYFIQFHTDPALRFLQTESESAGAAPGGWALEFGKGRVACLTPGHTAEVHAHPEYRAWIRALLTHVCL